MPTGYTAGIIDGTTKDFREFATHCLRGFGATIHMRDEPFDKPWEPRIPSEYHKNEIAKSEAELRKAKELSLEQIANERKIQLTKDKFYHSDKINEIESTAKRLNEFLLKAEEFVPPTTEHQGIKEFMIQQLTETIKFDGSTKYHKEQLERIEAELSDMKPEIIKANIVSYAERNLKYHIEEQAKEYKRCAESNLWVEQFLSAI